MRKMMYPVGTVFPLRTAASASACGRAFVDDTNRAIKLNDKAPLASGDKYKGSYDDPALNRLSVYYAFDYVEDAMIDAMHLVGNVTKHTRDLFMGGRAGPSFEAVVEDAEEREAIANVERIRARNAGVEYKDNDPDPDIPNHSQQPKKRRCYGDRRDGRSNQH